MGVAMRLSEGVRSSGRDDKNESRPLTLCSLVAAKFAALQTQLLQGRDGANSRHDSLGCAMVQDQLLQWEVLCNSLQCI